VSRVSKIAIIAAAATVAGVFVAYGANPKVGGAAMYENKNIVENAVNSEDHTTLVASVKAAGLVSTLEGKGQAVHRLRTEECVRRPAGTVNTLLKPENKAKLTKVLTCHVVAAEAMAKTVANMIKDDGGEHDIKTVGGCVLKTTESMGKITLTEESGGVAHVTMADVKQSNGVIHVVDKVLLAKM
jgi:uncharacterized surface protein with fasciclin (FAS1) repeats